MEYATSSFRQFLKMLTPPLCVDIYRQMKQWMLQSVPGRKFKNNSRVYKAKRLTALTRLCAIVAKNQELADLPSLGRPEMAFLDERVVEYPWILTNLINGYRLLDVGCVLNYQYCADVLKAKFKQVYFQNIVPQILVDSGFSFQVVQDIREPIWADATFDAVTCISTLEHIGMDNSGYTGFRESEICPDDYLIAVKEIIRVVKPGGQVLITVPFGRPDNLGWIHVFGSDEIRRLGDVIAPHRYTFEFFQSYPGGWQRCSQKDCEDRVYGEGVPAAGAIAALKIVKNEY